MLFNQELCEQALGELRAARDQIIQSYDNPPLNLNKEEKPRVKRQELMRFVCVLVFAEESKQGVVYMDSETLKKAKELITSLPPQWHNGVDYSPLLTALDKWIQIVEEEDKKMDRMATWFLVALATVVVLDFVCFVKCPCPTLVVNLIIFFLYVILMLGTFSEKYRSHR